MEKLIELLRERKPNFDENHILDMMYSEGTIFIKDGKPIYAYSGIGPVTERMIINGKIGFIKRLVDSDKIDERKLDEYRGNDYDHFNRIETLIQILSIQDDPIDLLCKLLKQWRNL